ncbi:MAG TPA: type I restriction enzyme HsdR N-terminal domain-containing protein [Chitinophagaceae bacterium]|nr:type I restriction enzyme HsdR N-terminal domain-containing protein [Chitinophagaceae bacterium]HNF71999.1 type I restriction enzyme HsdR N-terminal domain-containing protein [Chitinophagaceae bacterium]
MPQNSQQKNTGTPSTIFDPVRKKYVALTPEEWVRQQLIHHLWKQKSVPLSLISVEKQIRLGNRIRRYDIVVYKHNLPWLVIECKSESIALSDHVLQQLLAYNSKLSARYLAISNGHELQVYDVEAGTWSSKFPAYEATSSI